jgi:hypothetical protein
LNFGLAFQFILKPVFSSILRFAYELFWRQAAHQVCRNGFAKKTRPTLQKTEA